MDGATAQAQAVGSGRWFRPRAQAGGSGCGLRPGARAVGSANRANSCSSDVASSGTRTCKATESASIWSVKPKNGQHAFSRCASRVIAAKLARSPCRCSASSVGETQSVAEADVAIRRRHSSTWARAPVSVRLHATGTSTPASLRAALSTAPGHCARPSIALAGSPSPTPPAEGRSRERPRWARAPRLPLPPSRGSGTASGGASGATWAWERVRRSRC